MSQEFYLVRRFCWLMIVVLHSYILLYKCAISVAAWITRRLVNLLAVTIMILAFIQIIVGVECSNDNGKGFAQIAELDKPSLLDATRNSPARSPGRLTSHIQQANKIRLDIVALKLSAEAEKESLRSKPGRHVELQFSSPSRRGSSAGDKGRLSGSSGPRILHRTKRASEPTGAATSPRPPKNNESYFSRLRRKIKQVVLPEKNYFRLVRRIHRWFWAYKKLQQAALDSGSIKELKKGSDLFKEEYARVDQIFLADEFYQRDWNAEAEVEEQQAGEDGELSASESGSNFDEDESYDSDDSASNWSDLRIQELKESLEELDDGWLDFEEETTEKLQEDSASKPSYDSTKVETMDFVYRVLNAVITRLEARLEELKMVVAAVEVKKKEAAAALEAEKKGVLLDVGSAQLEGEQFDPFDQRFSRPSDEPMSQEQIANAMARAKRTIIKEAKKFAKNELLSLATVAAYKGLALYVSCITVSDPMIASHIIEPLLYLLGGASTPLSVGYLRDVELRAALGIVHRIKPIPNVTCSRSEYAKLKAASDRNNGHIKSE